MLDRLVDHINAVNRASQVSGALSVIIHEKKLITYRELAEALGVNTGKMLCDTLANIAKYDFKDSDPLSSSVVISENHGIPAKGFFEYAKKLGVLTEEDSKYDFWVKELIGLGYSRDNLEEVVLPEVLDQIDLDSLFNDSEDDDDDYDIYEKDEGDEDDDEEEQYF